MTILAGPGGPFIWRGLDSSDAGLGGSNTGRLPVRQRPRGVQSFWRAWGAAQGGWGNWPATLADPDSLATFFDSGRAFPSGGFAWPDDEFPNIVGLL
jgi:hypothetical protein